MDEASVSPRGQVRLDELPPALAAELGGAELVPITIGRSTAVVARVIGSGRPDRVLKLVARDPGDGDPSLAGPSLTDEVARLEWLAGRVPVPEVIAHGGDEHAEWVVMTALEGVDAARSGLGTDVARLAGLMGTALRNLHDALDPAECPFDGSTTTLVAHGRARVAAGAVDPGDFEPIHHGVSPEELLGHIEGRIPAPPADPVVTHGDFCLPNVVFAGEAVSGYVDVGLLGVGDRYRDLGIGARSVAENLGGGAVGPFFDAYGVEWPDLARVDFFVMLDELF